jgi:sugar phosphate isomerase/epimerase
MRYAFANHIFTWHPHRRGAAPPPPDHRRLQIAWIARAGFDGVEMGDFWMDFYRMADADLRAIRAEFDNAGLPVVALNCLRKAVTWPRCAAENQADLRRAVEVAHLLGAQLVNISLAMPHALIGQVRDENRGQPHSVGSSRQSPAEHMEEAATFLRDLADRAAPAGIQLSVELHHNALTDTGATVARLVRLIDRPNVGGNPDLGNLYWAYDVPEEPYEEALLRVLAAGMNFWHVKNIQRVHFPELSRSAFVPAPLPDGDIDYRWCLMTVRGGGYDGWISIEGAGPGDVLAVAERGLTYLRQIEADLRALAP